MELPKSVDGIQNFSRKSPKDISSEDTETHLEETGLEASYQSGKAGVSTVNHCTRITVPGGSNQIFILDTASNTE